MFATPVELEVSLGFILRKQQQSIIIIITITTTTTTTLCLLGYTLNLNTCVSNNRSGKVGSALFLRV